MSALGELIGSTQGAAAAALLLILKTSLLVLLAMGLSRLMARRSAAVRHLIWAVALSGLLALPAASSLAPRLPLAVLPATTAPAPAGEIPATASSPAETAARAAESGGGPAGVLEIETATTPAWRGLLPLAPAALSLALAGYLALGVGRVRRLSRRAVPLTGEPAWAGLLESLRARAGIRRPVDLRVTDALAVPSTWGLLRPCILLPAEARGWPEPWRRDVLVHELAHIRRWDWPLHLAARLACAVYWFNPLVWLARRSLALEAERACDDQVLLAGSSGADYARRLLDLTRRTSRRPVAALGVLAMARRARLSRRIDFILDPHQRRTTMKRFEILFTASLSLMLLVGLGGLQLVEAQPGDGEAGSMPLTLREVHEELTPLMAVARAGDLQAVRRHLEAGADPRESVAGHGTPLLLAADAGHGDVAELLMAWGADPDDVETARPRDLPRSPLGAAARSGHRDVVELLLDHGAAVDLTPEGDASPLMLAARGGHADVVRSLLARGADPNLVVPGDGTPLIAAARSGRFVVVELLRGAGADPHLEVEGDGTPLSAAVEAGATEVVELLLHPVSGDDRADVTLSGAPDAVDGTSVTLHVDPLVEAYEAAVAGELHLQQVDEAGTAVTVEAADPSATGRLVEVYTMVGRTEAGELRSAASGPTEQARIVDMLLDAGADPNLAVPGDGTPLIAAARAGDLALAERLLQAGAEVDRAVPGDGNPLIMAAANGHLDVVRLLVEGGADLDMAVPGDENALIGAAAGGHREVVRYLLDRGADVNAAVRTDGEVRTALSQAIRHGHAGIAELLRAYGAVR